MTLWKLIIRNLTFYRWKNLPVILGISISAAVLTGALIVGDSVSHSLYGIVDLRLGAINHTVTTGERFVTSSLAGKLQQEMGVTVSPLLLSEGMAVVGGGQSRVNNVQVLGVGESFDEVLGIEPFYKELPDDEAIISENLAVRLNLVAGDEFLLRIRKASLIPINAPFVSDEDLTVSSRLTVKAIAGDDQMARFNLRISQTSPYNVFVSSSHLNRIMELENKANTLLFSSKSALPKDSVFSAIRRSWTLEDIGLSMRESPQSDEYEIISERVFLDPPVINALQSLPRPAEFILTYFVNSISNKSLTHRNFRKGKPYPGLHSVETSKGKMDFSEGDPSPKSLSDADPDHNKFAEGIASTPYSFVSTLPEPLLTQNEIIVNKWLAEDLKIIPGDTLLVRYYTVGPLRSLTDSEETFVVKEIVSLAGRYADISLMPEIPGLSDAGNCRDWETGIPIDLERIRDKDEKYWTDFKGTPKAFISLPLAKELWENTYGSYTAARFSSAGINRDTLITNIAALIDPASLGFLVSAVKDDSRDAAGQGVDFSELFLGLSFFVLLSASILALLLLILNLEGRRSQIQTLSFMGISRKTINILVFAEGFILSITGSLLGAGLAILYTGLVFSALNGVWADIVRTDMMQMIVRVPVLLSGFLLSTLISWAALFFTSRSFLNPKSKKRSQPSRISAVRIRLYAAMAMLVTSVILIFTQILKGEDINSGIFFLAGGLMLISMLLLFFHSMDLSGRHQFNELTVFSLSIKNSIRNRSRSLGIVSLLAIGTFIVLSTGANRKDLFADAADKSSGTGGFTFFSESTVPVTRDLNDPAVSGEFGFTEDYRYVQFSRMPGDDASCLNLNRISNPVILGVNPGELEGRFSFISRTPWLSSESPWSSLKNPLPGGLIPAIADQTVIKWGLGMKTGDTLVYTDGKGKDLNLLLIGGLANSIFQGHLLIADEYFQKHFPDQAGSEVFLIEAEAGTEPEEELNLIFRDFGWEMTTTGYRLAQFNSVENTYLSIFLIMGALAILIGTVGLSIILARSILERKNEIALLKAVGIGSRSILRLIMSEYLLLLLVGILIGILTSSLAVLPALLSPNTGISFSTVLLITGTLCINGVFWIWLMAKVYLNDKTIAVALKND